METTIQPTVDQPVLPEEDEWLKERNELDRSEGPENCVPEWAAPGDLKKHLLNTATYGDAADPKFIESVERHGILTPLIVTKNGTILSGHRRCQAAVILKLERVPIWRHLDDLDELEERRQLLAANEQRQMTNYQKGRHYKELLAVEKELAARKRAAAGGNGKHALTENSRKRAGRAPTAKEKAAAAVGLSPKTADQTAEVGDVIDALGAAGATEQADALHETLNAGPISKARRAAVESAATTSPNGQPKPAPRNLSGRAVFDTVGQKVPERLWPVFQEGDVLFRKAMSSLASLKAELDTLKKAGLLPHYETSFGNLRDHVKFARPYAVCPFCVKGIGKNAGPCKTCKDLGYMPKDVFKRIPKDQLPPELAKRLEEQEASRKQKAPHR